MKRTREKPKNTMKNKFLSNTFWILGGQIVKILISFVISMLTARYLGPSNYGVINYVGSYIAFFTSLVGLGLNGVIIYELGNHRDEEGEILGTSILMRFITGIFSTAIFMFLIHLTDGDDSTIIAVSKLQAIQLPFLAFDTINYWYQSNLLSKNSVIIQTIGNFITSIYKVYLLITSKSVVWFSFATSLDIILLAFMYYLAYMKQGEQRLAVSFTIGKRILKGSTAFILANMMVFVYGQIDKIMIKQMLNSTEQVGLYSVAIAVSGIIGFIPGAILDSSRPVIVNAKNKDEDLYQLRLRQLFAGIIWICIIYSIFMTIFAKTVIQILYGSDYLGATNSLRIAVWYSAFSYLGSGRNLWLICENKNKYVFTFSALGAVTNVVLNAIMIPFWGIEGAAVATLLTQILANSIYPILFIETRQYGRLIFDAFRLKNIDIKHIFKLISNQIKT